MGLLVFAEHYAVFALLHHGSAPGGMAAAWLHGWIGPPGFFTPLALLLLLFPTGRLPSRRWRPAAWLAVGGVPVFSIGWWLKPGPLDILEFVDNPLGVGEASGPPSGRWRASARLDGEHGEASTGCPHKAGPATNRELGVRRLPAGLLALCLAGTAAGIALYVVSAVSADREGDLLLAVVLPVGMLAFPLVGALIASRRRENAIGSLFLAFGLVNAIGIPADGYYRFEPGPLPGAEYGAWFQHWTVQTPGIFTFFVFFLLLFPDGRLPSSRWRGLAWFSGSATLLFVLLVALKPGDLAETHPPLQNPLAVAALAGVWNAVEVPLMLAVMLCVPAAAAGFVIRFRRSRGVERQQLKWFALAAVTIGVVVGIAPVIFQVEALWWLWPVLFLVGTTSVPLAAGIAILRYRLYEIDRIISRTLAYALVLGVLAGAYAGLVVGIQALTRPLTGASDLAVAASTLAVVAAFRPLSRRIRGAVDRRFNRARYDAARTIDAFSVRLRDELDLEALNRDLTAVVEQTMQPVHVSVWSPRRGRS